jgi:hypothetical protein
MMFFRGRETKKRYEERKKKVQNAASFLIFSIKPKVLKEHIVQKSMSHFTQVHIVNIPLKSRVLYISILFLFFVGTFQSFYKNPIYKTKLLLKFMLKINK